MKKLITILFIGFATFLTAQDTLVVNYVYDADSYFFKGFSKSRRMSNIDAPEKKNNIYVSVEQPYADSAKKEVERLIKGKSVIVTTYPKKDMYGRNLISVKLDTIDVGLWLIEKGLVHYVATGQISDEMKAKYKEAEKVAKKNKVGLWSDKKVYTPAYWRKKYKGYINTTL